MRRKQKVSENASPDWELDSGKSDEKRKTRRANKNNPKLHGSRGLAPLAPVMFAAAGLHKQTNG